MRRDFIYVGILWLTLTLIGELLVPYFPFPPRAAHEAVISDESFYVLLVLGTPVFTFVVAMLGYSIWRFRAQGDEPQDGATMRGNSWVAGLWLGITGGLCLLVIIHPGLTGMAAFASNQQADLLVKAVGRQWAWDISYPAQKITSAPELVLPVGKRVRFEITSQDVLHGFWIPAFRDKVDAIPGTVTVLYITPTQLSSSAQDPLLRIQCTEICGLQHTYMNLPIRITSEADFNAWVESFSSGDAVANGARLAKAQGCEKCHSTDGSKGIGPTWKELYEHEVTLADGTTVKADDAYIRKSILEPNAQIVQGFTPNLMPQDFGKTLTPEQIDALLAYIKSIE